MNGRVYVPAALLGSLSLVGVGALHATIVPDTPLYLHSTSWFYPSPLGRLVGYVGGYPGLAFITALSALFMPFAVGKVAEKYGHDPVRSAWMIFFFPAAWYLFAVSVDAGAAFCLVSALAVESRRFSLSLLAIASLFHLALIPSALAIAAIKYVRGVAAIFVGFFTAALIFAYMVATPYGLLVSNHVNFQHFLVGGFLTFLVGIAPLAFARKAEKDGLFLIGLTVSAIGGSEAAMQQHFQPRYCLPGALILAAALAPKVSARYVYGKDGARRESRRTSAGVPAISTAERG